MTLTKKHYRHIAALIRNSKSKSEVARRLSQYFKDTNPAFDEAKFMEACGEQMMTA